MKYINMSTDDNSGYQKSLKEYDIYFETIKHRLPKKFVDFYMSPYLHDSILLEYKIVKRQTRKKTFIDVITQWKRYDNGENFNLIFKDVIKFDVNVDLVNGYVEFGDYIIGEFLEIDKKYLSFEFLFYDSDNTVKIVFNKLCFGNTGDGSVC